MKKRSAKIADFELNSTGLFDHYNSSLCDQIPAPSPLPRLISCCQAGSRIISICLNKTGEPESSRGRHLVSGSSPSPAGKIFCVKADSAMPWARATALDSVRPPVPHTASTHTPPQHDPLGEPQACTQTTITPEQNHFPTATGMEGCSSAAPP